MKTQTPMDHLLRRLYDMNDLLESDEDVLALDQHALSSDEAQRKKKKKKGEGKRDGFFSAVVGELFFRRSGKERYESAGEPSDGHPQEELTPDFQLFRGFNHNNATWTLYWPDLVI